MIKAYLTLWLAALGLSVSAVVISNTEPIEPQTARVQSEIKRLKTELSELEAKLRKLQETCKHPINRRDREVQYHHILGREAWDVCRDCGLREYAIPPTNETFAKRFWAKKKMGPSKERVTKWLREHDTAPPAEWYPNADTLAAEGE